MQITADIATIVVSGAFVLAFLFGAVGNKTHFCTMGSVSDVVNMGDWGRMRMWLLSIAVAILGSNALHVAGMVDLSKSIYPTPNFTWLSYIVGGFIFGVGMTLGSGCGSKTLIRIGGGNLKSVVVFIFLGVSAYMSLRGIFGAWRVSLFEPVSINLAAHHISGQDLPSLAAVLLGLDKKTLQIAVSLILAGGIMAFVFMSKDFRSRHDLILGGVAVGLIVAGGWYVTGQLGYLPEDPNTLEEAFVATNTGRPESFTFVAPAAYTLELLMLWTDSSKIVTFGIASTLGVVGGSLAYSLSSGTFRWEGFRDVEDTANHIIGGILMGFGGVMSFGCTIGQAVTGFSTLALGSILTFLAIVVGSATTMKYQYWRLMRK